MIDTTYEAAEDDEQPASPVQSSIAAKSKQHAVNIELPVYMTEVYDWAYVSPAWVPWLDHNIVVKTLLFCNDGRLMRRYLDKIKSGMRVWQVAHVYGNLVQRAAKRVGQDGCFHLTDITPIQIMHGRRKLAGIPWAKIIHHDAAIYQGEKGHPYDLVCSFMLLHEVPEDWKRRIVDNMLAQIPAHGEALFVDYHGPCFWQPVRYILKLVNRFLEPFANALWDHDISHYASNPDAYSWEKETIFGGVYQIVSVKHKNPG
jgi:hypothetical protein